MRPSRSRSISETCHRVKAITRESRTLPNYLDLDLDSSLDRSLDLDLCGENGYLDLPESCNGQTNNPIYETIKYIELELF